MLFVPKWSLQFEERYACIYKLPKQELYKWDFMLWDGRRKEGQTMVKWQWLMSWYLRSIAIYMFSAPFNPCSDSISYISKTNEGGEKK